MLQHVCMFSNLYLHISPVSFGSELLCPRLWPRIFAPPDTRRLRIPRRRGPMYIKGRQHRTEFWPVVSHHTCMRSQMYITDSFLAFSVKPMWGSEMFRAESCILLQFCPQFKSQEHWTILSLSWSLGFASLEFPTFARTSTTLAKTFRMERTGPVVLESLRKYSWRLNTSHDVSFASLPSGILWCQNVPNINCTIVQYEQYARY